MSRSRQILVNAVTQWGVTGLSAVLGLLVVPFLIQKLGKDGYGLVAVILAITGVCALADLGISGALTRQLAEALAKNDTDEFNQYVSTAAAVNLFAGCFCAGVVFALAVPMARLFSLPESLFTEGVALLRVFGTAHLVLTFLMFAPKAVLASHNRFDMACVIDAVRRLLHSVGLLAVLSLTSLGLVGWALVCIAVDLLITVMLWKAAFGVQREMRVGPAWIAPKRLKSLFGLGSRLTVLQISGQLSVNADPFILSACLGPASLSLYRPPSQAVGAFSQVIFTLANQLHPLATVAHTQEKKEDVTKILFRGTKHTMLMNSVACAILISSAYPLCKMWLESTLGSQYTVCAAVLTIQAATTLAGGAQWPVLLGINKTAFAAYGRLALAVLNVVVSWLLVRYTRLGVLGAVIPTMAIEFAWRPILAWYTCRAIGVSTRRYIRQSYLTPLLIGATVAAISFFLRWLVPVNGLWTLLWSFVTLGLTGTALIWFAGLSTAERASIESTARSLTVHLRAQKSFS